MQEVDVAADNAPEKSKALRYTLEECKDWAMLGMGFREALPKKFSAFISDKRCDSLLAAAIEYVEICGKITTLTERGRLVRGMQLAEDLQNDKTRIMKKLSEEYQLTVMS